MNMIKIVLLFVKPTFDIAQEISKKKNLICLESLPLVI